MVRQFATDSYQRRMLENICINEFENVTIRDVNFIEEDNNWMVVRELLINISQTCEDMLKHCRYGLELVNCMELFDTVLTDEGTFRCLKL